MRNSEQILSISFVVILLVVAVAVGRVTFAAYGTTLTGRKFRYKFDKTRLPAGLYRAAVATGITFAYALVISQGAMAALGFSLLIAPFVLIGCLTATCYVLFNSKNVSTKQKKDQNWKVPR